MYNELGWSECDPQFALTHSLFRSRSILAHVFSGRISLNAFSSCMRSFARSSVGCFFVAIAKANINFHNCFMPKAFISLSTHNKIGVRKTQQERQPLFISQRTDDLLRLFQAYRNKTEKIRLPTLSSWWLQFHRSQNIHTANEWGTLRHTPLYTTRAYGFETNARDGFTNAHFPYRRHTKGPSGSERKTQTVDFDASSSYTVDL